MELVDLSVPVVTGMPVYPGDPEVSVEAALTTAADGVNVRRVHLGSHAGTHVDAPFHVDDAWPGLEELPLSRFAGPATVVDVRDLAPREAVTPDRLPVLVAGTVLLFMTGWSRHWGAPGYLDHPYLAPETAAAIVAAGVRTVGVDALSVDRTPSPGGGPVSGDGLAAHRILLGARGVIAENLTGLERVHAASSAGRAAEVFLFPLRMAGDGAPTRAVARLL